MMHSVPHFPVIEGSSWTAPTAGTKFYPKVDAGSFNQHFFCFNVDILSTQIHYSFLNL